MKLRLLHFKGKDFSMGAYYVFHFENDEAKWINNDLKESNITDDIFVVMDFYPEDIVTYIDTFDSKSDAIKYLKTIILLTGELNNEVPIT